MTEVCTKHYDCTKLLVTFLSAAGIGPAEAGVLRPRGTDQQLLQQAWSQQRDQPVRGLMLCPVVAPRILPQPTCSQATPHSTASEPGAITPLPAKRSKRTKAQQAAESIQATKGKGKGKAARPSPRTPQPSRWVLQYSVRHVPQWGEPVVPAGLGAGGQKCQLCQPWARSTQAQQQQQQSAVAQ
ncbi:hypothetical protein QJQ45_003848 [Haematococcus lacustris]|nr:hypothetical protein QJQ45_003848 [Haematococcus lacustris]